MKYIRSCENCLKEVRFPLDKGALLVKCPYCGFTFRIDPDDPSIYKAGRFDLPSPTQSFEAQIPNNLTIIHKIKNKVFEKLNEENSNKNIKLIIVLFIIFLLGINIWKISNTINQYPANPQIQKEEKIQLDRDKEEDIQIDTEKVPYQI